MTSKTTLNNIINKCDNNLIYNELKLLITIKLDETLQNERFYFSSVNYDILENIEASFDDYSILKEGSLSVSIFFNQLLTCINQKSDLLSGNFMVWMDDIINFYINFKYQINNAIDKYFDDDILAILQYKNKKDFQNYPINTTSDIIFSTVNLYLNIFRNIINHLFETVEARQDLINCLAYNLNLKNDVCLVDKQYLK